MLSDKRIAFVSVASWALLVLALLKLNPFFSTWELNALVMVALLGLGASAIAVRAAIGRRRLLLGAAVVYLLLYVTYNAWGVLVIGRATGARGIPEALAVTLWIHGQDIIAWSSRDKAMAIAMGYSLVAMPIVQVITTAYLARGLSRRTSNP